MNKSKPSAVLKRWKILNVTASGLTAVHGLHLSVDGVFDHQWADEELGPPETHSYHGNSLSLSQNNSEGAAAGSEAWWTC